MEKNLSWYRDKLQQGNLQVNCLQMMQYGDILITPGIDEIDIIK